MPRQPKMQKILRFSLTFFVGFFSGHFSALPSYILCFSRNLFSFPFLCSKFQNNFSNFTRKRSKKNFQLFFTFKVFTIFSEFLDFFSSFYLRPATTFSSLLIVFRSTINLFTNSKASNFKEISQFSFHSRDKNLKNSLFSIYTFFLNNFFTFLCVLRCGASLWIEIYCTCAGWLRRKLTEKFEGG